MFVAFAVNVAPAGSGAAVRLVIASPSGSAALTVKLIRVPSSPEAVAGAVTTGARSTLFTVIAVVAEPLRAFDAVNVTLVVPDCVKSGVQLNVPEVFEALAVNVAPDGSGAAVRLVIASPSLSTAETVNSISVFSSPEAVAGAVTAGGLSPAGKTVMTVVAEPVRAFAAVKVTLCVPSSAGAGVQLKVPDVFAAFAVKVAPAGSGAAVSDVMASPSGSDAETVKVISVFAAPEAVAEP